MRLVRTLALITFVAIQVPFLSSMSASADPATPATAVAPSATPAKKMSKIEIRAKLKECTKQADAKKLHGDERKTFRLDCIKKAGVERPASSE